VLLKRKYGTREGWSRIVEREVSVKYTSTGELEGYLSLIKFERVGHPLYVQYEGDSICIVDDGYSWLQFFPDHRHFSITTMLNEDQSVIQWYIDITKENGYDSTRGPWMDDLFLDLIILPGGKLIEKDQQELEEAYLNKIISEEDYMLAKSEFRRLIYQIKSNELNIEKLTEEHLTCFNKIK
jgi:uncharacterized protein